MQVLNECSFISKKQPLDAVIVLTSTVLWDLLMPSWSLIIGHSKSNWPSFRRKLCSSLLGHQLEQLSINAFLFNKFGPLTDLSMSDDTKADHSDRNHAMEKTKLFFFRFWITQVWFDNIHLLPTCYLRVSISSYLFNNIHLSLKNHPHSFQYRHPVPGRGIIRNSEKRRSISSEASVKDAITLFPHQTGMPNWVVFRLRPRAIPIIFWSDGPSLQIVVHYLATMRVCGCEYEYNYTWHCPLGWMLRLYSILNFKYIPGGIPITFNRFPSLWFWFNRV